MTPQLKRVRNNQHHTVSGRNKITTKRRNARSLYFLRYTFFFVCLFFHFFFFSFQNVPLFRACLRYNELDLAPLISTFFPFTFEGTKTEVRTTAACVLYFQSGANEVTYALTNRVEPEGVFRPLFFWYGELVSCLVGLQDTGRESRQETKRVSYRFLIGKTTFSRSKDTAPELTRGDDNQPRRSFYRQNT